MERQENRMNDTHPKRPFRLRRVLGTTLLTASLVTLAGTASAQGGISDEQAKQIALKEVPGVVIEIERDDEDGQAVIEVEIRDAAGAIHEVTLDAKTGDVIEVEVDDDDDDDGDDDDDDDDDDD
jgi:uncharacterized membrane protein YkoI